MKTLTFFQAIMLQNFVFTGFYRMNIGLPFRSDPRSFLVIIGIMGLVALGMLSYFMRRMWL